jgi:hypothetical protein
MASVADGSVSAVGPVVDHQLVHTPPVQEGAHLARLVVEERVQLLVDQHPVE